MFGILEYVDIREPSENLHLVSLVQSDAVLGRQHEDVSLAVQGLGFAVVSKLYQLHRRA